MDKRHTEGQICETILAEYLLRQDMYVFKPEATSCPVDVIAISKEGKIYLLDAKKDAKRIWAGRTIEQRIYRPLTPFQKLLGVRMAYVDINTREVYIVPPLNTESTSKPKTESTSKPKAESTPKSKAESTSKPKAESTPKSKKS